MQLLISSICDPPQLGLRGGVRVAPRAASLYCSDPLASFSSEVTSLVPRPSPLEGLISLPLEATVMCM